MGPHRDIADVSLCGARWGCCWHPVCGTKMRLDNRRCPEQLPQQFPAPHQPTRTVKDEEPRGETPIHFRDRKGVQRNGGLPSPRGGDAFSLPDRDTAARPLESSLGLRKVAGLRPVRCPGRAENGFISLRLRCVTERRTAARQAPQGPQDHSRGSCTRWERAQVQGGLFASSCSETPASDGCLGLKPMCSACLPLGVLRSKGTAPGAMFPPGHIYSAFITCVCFSVFFSPTAPAAAAKHLQSEQRTLTSLPATVPKPSKCPSLTDGRSAQGDADTSTVLGELPRRSRGAMARSRSVRARIGLVNGKRGERGLVLMRVDVYCCEGNSS